MPVMQNVHRAPVAAMLENEMFRSSPARGTFYPRPRWPSRGGRPSGRGRLMSGLAMMAESSVDFASRDKITPPKQEDRPLVELELREKSHLS